MAQRVKILPAMQETQVETWVRKIPWRRENQSTLVFSPREFHGQSSLVGYSPWGHKESDMTECLALSLAWAKSSFFFLLIIEKKQEEKNFVTHANYWHGIQNWVSLNKVLLAHSHTHSLFCRLWLLLLCNRRGVVTETVWPADPIFTIHSSVEKFSNLCPSSKLWEAEHLRTPDVKSWS